MLVILVFAANISFAQVQDSKTIKKRYDGKTAVSLSHAQGPILVKNSPDGKVYIEATISAKAKDRENLDIVLDHFIIDENSLGNRVELETAFETQVWNSNNGVTMIKFKDGKKVKGIRDIKLSATLLVPNLKELELSNKYGRIDMEAAMPENLEIELYSGKLAVAEACNKLDLNMKYSKANLSGAGDAKMELFDCEMEIGGIRSADVSSKYSEIDAGNVAGNLTLTTYDDNWKIGDIKGKLNISDKYSEFEIETINEADCTFFDADLRAVSVGKFIIDESKYSKIKVGEIGKLEAARSFDDYFSFNKAGALLVGDSKYSEYNIVDLANMFSLGQSFDDDVELEKVAAGFSSISMNAKYTELDFWMADNAEFEMYINMQYGEFDYPEKDLDIKVYKEKDSNLTIIGYVGDRGKIFHSRVNITGYDNRVTWH
ncbi:MAG TPA: hypothetical protein ENJ95_21935 [Bacteroidetes bacterium]|nr:hypothetical protein [Bacteroidota bacterium]